MVCTLSPAGVRGNDFVCFYDWDEGRLVRRIDVGAVKDVIWSDNGELVAIAGDSSFYILQARTAVMSSITCFWKIAFAVTYVLLNCYSWSVSQLDQPDYFLTCLLAQFNSAAVEAAFAAGGDVDEDGIEDAFELVAEVPEKIR